MLFGLALATITVASQDFPRTGVATYYAKGVIERVYEYRLRIGQISECSDCRGFVALLSPSDLGKKVWLRHPSKGTIGPLLVVDCAAKQDVKALQARGWVVDLGYSTSRGWGLRGPLDDVTVLQAEPRLRRNEHPGSILEFSGNVDGPTSWVETPPSRVPE